jgi:hypothetical protein
MHDYRKELSLAVKASYFLRNLEIDPKDALDLADYLLAFFGYDNEIIDNMLMKYDRDVFYQMEDLGLLKTSQTTEKIKEGNYAGKEWTTNKWILSRDNVHRIIDLAYEKTRNMQTPEAVYKELFNSVSVEDLKNDEAGLLSSSEFVFNEEWYSLMKKELEEHVDIEREKLAKSGNFYDYLSIFATMLSPDIKPLAYLAMDSGKEYTVSGVLKSMANMFGCSPEELENHVNIGSIMESLVSIGAVQERKIELHKKDTKIYSKSRYYRAFDAIAAYAIKATREELEPAGLMLSDIFSISVAQKVGRAHSQNLFELIKMLAESSDRGFTLYEIREIMDSDSVRHEVRLFNSLGLLDYKSFSGNGGPEGKLKYRVLRPTSLEELHEKGFVKRPEKCWRLEKTIGFVNENQGKDIDRFDISGAAGSDIDFSSKYLVMLSRAGVLERKAEWNTKRSVAKANENTVKVWDGLLSLLYGVAKEAVLQNSVNAGILDRLEAAVLKDNRYGSELKGYLNGTSLIEDCSAHFEYLSRNRHRIGKNPELADMILNVAKDGIRIYEIVEKLKKETAITYAGTQWHVRELLRKGLLEKDGKVYTAKGPKRLDKRQ